MILAAHVALQKAQAILIQRVEELRELLQAGDEAVRLEYYEAVCTLAAIAPATAPEAGGAMLTTAEMAERLGIAPKTLLRHKQAGQIRPAVQRGKLGVGPGESGYKATRRSRAMAVRRAFQG